MQEEEKGISPAVVVLLPLGLGIAAAVGIAALARAAEPPAPPPGRANLYGKVTDAVTLRHIRDVLVTLDGMQTYTDSAGNYIFGDLAPGSYTLTFEKDGYETAVF